MAFSLNLCPKFAELRDLAKVGQSNTSGWALVVLFYVQPTNLLVLGRIWTKNDQNEIFFTFLVLMYWPFYALSAQNGTLTTQLKKSRSLK